jgi:hypothetical protein
MNLGSGKLAAGREENPFVVQTPEDISAADATSLFVDVFTDFHSIPSAGHTFLHGPRGSGKSMMFRFLEPDCQMLANTERLSGLPFYGVYVPIKSTNLMVTEFRRLEDVHASTTLNEHFLTVYVAVRVFVSLLNRASLRQASDETCRELDNLYRGPFHDLLSASGWKGKLPKPASDTNAHEYLSSMLRVLNGLYTTVISYLRQLSFRKRPLYYTGPLCGFVDFLLPLLREISGMTFMPKGPVYLLIDDADNLSYVQTTILNTWVYSRMSAYVSLKISTQLAYKTYRTVGGPTIDTPHDYSEVNISAVYTSRRSENRYHERVSAIVRKRLAIKHVPVDPEEFFPGDSKQEAEIRSIERELEGKWEQEGRGFRPSDDAYRYGRPDFIKKLAGSRKAGSTYSYSGFSQLVHLSSGIIRYFLEAAAKMYADTISAYPGEQIRAIRPHVQDRVVRELAEAFLTLEFDKRVEDEGNTPELLDKTQKLRNLLYALGGTFHEILISNAAERRVFSIALSDSPDEEVAGVLRLGVQYGYFHESTIGNKEGTGRTKLYILSRRLAPFFDLDPNGFAGYKFVTCDVLRVAMRKPKTFVGRIRSLGEARVLDDSQLTLFGEEHDTYEATEAPRASE